jgi:hypothetical protein
MEHLLDLFKDGVAIARRFQHEPVLVPQAELKPQLRYLCRQGRCVVVTIRGVDDRELVNRGWFTKEITVASN